MNNTADQQDPFTPPDQIMPELGGMRYRKHSAKAAYHPTTASPEFVRNRDSTSDEEEEEDREDGPATQPSDSSASADADNRCHIERLPDDVLSRVLGFLPTDFPIAGGVYVACLLNKQFHKVATQVLYKNFKLPFSLEKGFKQEVKSALHQIPACSAQSIRNFTLVCQPLCPDDEDSEEVQKRFAKLAPAAKRILIKVNWKQLVLALNQFVTEKMSGMKLSSISIQISYNHIFEKEHAIIPNVPIFGITGHNLPSSLLTLILGQTGFPNSQNAGAATEWANLCRQMANVIDQEQGVVTAVDMEMVGSNAILGSILNFIRHNRKTMKHLRIAFPSTFGQIRCSDLPFETCSDSHGRTSFSDPNGNSYPESAPHAFGHNIIMPQLRTLEIYNPNQLPLIGGPLPSLLEAKFLKSLSLHGISDSYFINQTALAKCHHVKHLKLTSCPVKQVDAFLMFMPRLLEEIVIVDIIPINQDDLDGMRQHPAKMSLLRHRDSLRLLVIDITDHEGDAHGAKPIPVFDDESEEVDIFAVNQCRELRYLKLPISPEFAAMIILPKLIEFATWQCGPNVTGVAPEQEELKEEAEQIASNIFELNGEPEGFLLKIISFQNGNYQNVFETGGEYQGEDDAFDHQAVFWGPYADESAIEVAMFERPKTRILLLVQFD